VARDGWGPPALLLGALGLAYLNALHPAQTEAVTYISGRSVSLMGLGYLGSLLARTLKENLLTQIDGQFYLLTQPLWLLRVNIDPELPVHTGLDAALALKGAALLALVLVGVVQLRRRPWLGLGLLWPFLHLLPTNSILPRLDVANDRQLYLALIGPAVLLAATIWGALPRRAALVSAGILALDLNPFHGKARTNLDALPRGDEQR
jgi:hypothetical protein